MIDPSRTTYALALIGDAGSVSLPITALQWEEQPGELAVRLQATCPVVALAGRFTQQLLALGAKVLLTADWGSGPQEVFRGTIWTWRYTDDGAEAVEITAYDDLIYLQQSEDDRVYPDGWLASAVLADLANDWGFTISNVPGEPNVVLPKLVFKGQKISQMMLNVLDEVANRGGGAWLVRASRGQIELVRPGMNRPVYALSTAHVTRWTDEQDLSDLVTEVQVLGAEADDGEGDVRPEVQEYRFGHTEFGRLLTIVRDPGADSPITAGQMADRLLLERGEPRRQQRFTAPDLPFLRRGDAIVIRAGTLHGRYFVDGIQHDADRKQMEITIDTSGRLSTPVGEV